MAVSTSLPRTIDITTGSSAMIVNIVIKHGRIRVMPATMVSRRVL